MPENSKLKIQNSKLPILVGPTGVGKSEIAFLLAKRLDAEIISADAFQVYRGLEVGTAQPPQEWQKEVPHHLVGVRDPHESWNAVEFAREAKNVIESVQARKTMVILVGGAGFYIRALVDGAPSGSAPTPEIRGLVLERIRELGNEKALAWLKERDPARAEKLHPNDIQRICRALEKTFETAPEKAEYDPLGPEKVLFWGLERSKDKLDLILKARAESMWRGGLLDETKKLMETGLTFDHPIWGAIGYAEAQAFLKGEWGEALALERIFRRTRQYAKRQWTWFKHQHEVHWLNLDDFQNAEGVVDALEKQITE
jgi:tRNA dimethylallyltransferase